jgi:hypothetical protein
MADTANTVLPPSAGAEGEILQLKSENETLRGELLHCEERIRVLQAQTGELVRLAVATRRLYETLTRDDVLSAIEEIVTNIIGSEQLAIFEVVATELRVARACGVDALMLDDIPHGANAVTRAVETGMTALCLDERKEASTPLAVVPLKLDRNVIAVIAIFGLLRQKAELQPFDHEILELLSRQGALALGCTSSTFARPTVMPPEIEAQRILAEERAAS